MFRDLATPIQSSLFRRLSAMLGLDVTNKQAVSNCADRMSALSDPATRRALADLPAHLLLDIGVRVQSPHTPPTVSPEGEALRNHMW